MSLSTPPSPPSSHSLEIIKEPECKRQTKISRVQRWRLEQEGNFPKRLRLGKHSVGWLKHEIDEWILRKANAR